jgi:hypothetical protein
MRFDLPARGYVPIRKPCQMRIPLGVVLTPFTGAAAATLCALPYCYDASSLVSVHGPRMPCPDSAVRFRDADRRRLAGSGNEAKSGSCGVGTGHAHVVH